MTNLFPPIVHKILMVTFKSIIPQNLVLHIALDYNIPNNSFGEVFYYSFVKRWLQIARTHLWPLFFFLTIISLSKPSSTFVSTLH